MIITQYIPKDKFPQFHDILCATGGKYLRNPFSNNNVIEVHYTPGNYKAQLEAWNRVTKPIKESRKDQWWYIVLRRFKLFI